MINESSGRGSGDYWTDLPSPARRPAGEGIRLALEVIAGANPLQRGERLDPDQLPEWLSPSSSDADLLTLAVIDAAKVPNLPEQLEASGLRHECLFSGDAEDELGALGPWLVAVDPGSRFTRNLFMEGQPGGKVTDLWMGDWGLFIRTSRSFDETRSHLRKFTKVRDENSAWLFFRFWDPDFMGCYLHQQDIGHTTPVQRLLDPAAIDSILITSPFDGVFSARLEVDSDAVLPRRQVVLHRREFEGIGADLADRRAARAFAASYPDQLGTMTLDEIRARISAARQACAAAGIREERNVGSFILLGAVFAPGFWREALTNRGWQVRHCGRS